VTGGSRGDDLLAAVRRSLSPGAGAAQLAAAVRADAPLAGTAGVMATADRLRDQLLGAGVLEPLLAEPDVTDVLVNGPGVVWVDRGGGVVDSGIRIDDEHELRTLAYRLAAAGGRRLDDASPFADAVLADGTRVHAALPPLASQGTTLSLRVPAKRAFSLDELVAAGSLPAAGADLLRRIVAQRIAFVVTGGTGTGKTTVLASLLSEVDAGERLVLVEDTPELRPRHPHVVRLQARPDNAEGAGGIPLAELVRQSLRMRPDRLVVGEVRGPEVVDLLAALNTGHDGGCATVHANRAEDVPARFEALAGAAGLSRATTHAQLAAAVRVVVHLRRDGDRRRVVDSVGVLAATVSHGGVAVAVAQRFGPDGTAAGPAAAALEALLADA
jgi:pilus assembly protein CpaF